mmetsp:Transcript_95121/g.307125  ORF Transcript_95121/g.307125 Transcript_95121/m.307125 type:complete len:510 (+) Transcript_95121:434-1963(+)
MLACASRRLREVAAAARAARRALDEHAPGAGPLAGGFRVAAAPAGPGPELAVHRPAAEALWALTARPDLAKRPLAGAAVAGAVDRDLAVPRREAAAALPAAAPLAPLPDAAVLGRRAGDAEVAARVHDRVAHHRPAAVVGLTQHCPRPPRDAAPAGRGARRPGAPLGPGAVHATGCVAGLRVARLDLLLVERLARLATGLHGHDLDVPVAAPLAAVAVAAATAPLRPLAPDAGLASAAALAAATAGCVLLEVAVEAVAALLRQLRDEAAAVPLAGAAAGAAGPPVCPGRDIAIHVAAELLAAASRLHQRPAALPAAASRVPRDLAVALLLAAATSLVALAPRGPVEDEAVHGGRAGPHLVQRGPAPGAAPLGLLQDAAHAGLDAVGAAAAPRGPGAELAWPVPADAGRGHAGPQLLEGGIAGLAAPRGGLEDALARARAAAAAAAAGAPGLPVLGVAVHEEGRRGPVARRCLLHRTLAGPAAARGRLEDAAVAEALVQRIVARRPAAPL